MRFLKFALGAAMVTALVGCNAGQPRIYRVAVDDSALDNLPPSCFTNNAVQTQRTIGTNLREERQFVIWDGAENKQYLDIGNYSLKLGSSDTINVGHLIEGANLTFSGQRVEQVLPSATSNYTSTQTFSLVVTFKDLGANPTGTIAASSMYSCTNCDTSKPPDNKVSCSTTLNFNSRRIDSSHFTGYTAQGG